MSSRDQPQNAAENLEIEENSILDQDQEYRKDSGGPPFKDEQMSAPNQANNNSKQKQEDLKKQQRNSSNNNNPKSDGRANI